MTEPDHGPNPENRFRELRPSNWSHEQPVPRRRVLSALATAAAGGALGYALQPWITGGRKDFAAAAGRLWEDVKQPFEYERNRWRRAYGDGRDDNTRDSGSGRVSTRAVVLDNDGKEYKDFLAGLGLTHVTVQEVLAAHFKIRGDVCNELPPRELWRNISATLRVADRLQETLGVPLRSIVSAYRCPAYNAACPGAAPQSYHVQNMALDLVYDCAPAKVAAAAESLRDKGVFTGGIGRYPNFTHVDTRGYKSDWG